MDYCEKHDMVPGSADDGKCVDCENESLRQQLKEGCEETVRYWDMYHEQRARAEIAEEQLAAKDAALEERNNVMHRAVEDAESLRKEVEWLKGQVESHWTLAEIRRKKLEEK